MMTIMEQIMIVLIIRVNIVISTDPMHVIFRLVFIETWVNTLKFPMVRVVLKSGCKVFATIVSSRGSEIITIIEPTGLLIVFIWVLFSNSCIGELLSELLSTIRLKLLSLISAIRDDLMTLMIVND